MIAIDVYHPLDGHRQSVETKHVHSKEELFTTLKDIVARYGVDSIVRLSYDDEVVNDLR